AVSEEQARAGREVGGGHVELAVAVEVAERERVGAHARGGRWLGLQVERTHLARGAGAGAAARARAAAGLARAGAARGAGAGGAAEQGEGSGESEGDAHGSGPSAGASTLARTLL